MGPLQASPSGIVGTGRFSKARGYLILRVGVGEMGAV